MIRVLGGEAKGRGLKVLRGQEIRPTPAKVRAALFNMVSDLLWDSSFLDLFAGSGSVGIEALSRGAHRVVFVERSPRAATLIQQNLAHSGFLEGANILNEDVFEALRRLEVQKDRFHFVFLDPPYEKGLVEKTLRSLAQLTRLLEPAGEIIAQHSPRETPPSVYEPFERKVLKSYGDSQLSFYL